MPIPNKNRVTKHQSAKMRVFCTLREWIIYGTLKPGERLVDQEISDYFEVSRTPVREAIQMLEAQKLVVIFPNKATVVSEIDMTNLEKWYLPLAHLHALAAELACRSITDEQLEELRKIDKQIMIYVKQGDVINTLREDVRFHNTILTLVDIEFILEFSDTRITHIQRFEYNFLRQVRILHQELQPTRQIA
jgi:DNA-binding GntR family transcriptional regulator